MPEAASTPVAAGSDAVVTWEDADDGILTIALNRPPANALGLPLIDGLAAALDHADARPDIKVMVIASRLDGFFAAGADIKHMGSIDAEAFSAYGRALRAPLNRLASPERLSIAAIDGLALGGGLELAMACTMRVGSARATFGLPEVKLGLIPGAGGTQRLPRLVGRGRALDIMLTARQVGAQEAQAIGLIDRLVEDGQAEAHALALARELRTMSQPALHAVVRAVDVSFEVPLPQGLTREERLEHGLFTDGEAAEGIAAFLEKRPPRFG
ncbi:MAG TPA: enoyl-CoA hydratase-related protein [Baekduia sp.]|uniref:enoyl-CoA hydratase/isomerase family protein n=1 Tax=Baekduia sp. TaxID=2600305 RepID=UPI002D76A14A|nr:enoyl-CoA hydratase-related protein [Baekduia sp.]HET6507894.1 enoyl-CoA hydratase-related protein [Baekduia sp.]